MKINITINGKEIEAEISQEELNKLQSIAKEKKKIGYERVKNGDMSYYVDWKGEAVSGIDEHDDLDDITYEAANYYSDRTVAENNARADKLMRQLRRFAVEHRKVRPDWNYLSTSKYCISYDYEYKEIITDSMDVVRDFGNVIFDLEQTAQLAIDTFHDELVWYFTEYKDSL